VVPGVAVPTSTGGTVLSGDAGANPANAGLGLGILGDTGLPPGVGQGQAPLGSSSAGLPQTANSNFGAIPGNVMSPPPAVAPPGTDSIVANPVTQAYQAATQAIGATFDASPQALPLQPQPIQPESLQAPPY